jgi:hypothetical protein
MHGGALEVTAHPGCDYIKQKYDLELEHIQELINGVRKPVRLVRKDGVYVATLP